jgi:hypothetical protein
MLREMWGKDIGDNTLMRLAKMDIFLPRNVHHLEIQLETAMFMLEELTVRNSCATDSIKAAW